MSAECEETNYRILMLGRTGSGKKTIRDRILRNSTEGKIQVVDTLFDTSEDVRKTAQVIQGSLKSLSPGPHVFLVVLENGADAEEESMTLINLNIILGPQFVNHAIIILTHTNRMKDITETSQEPKENKGLKIFCDSCRRQIIAINNTNNNSETIKKQREQLFFSVCELSDKGMRYYQYNISINSDCPKGLTIERIDSRWNAREISEKDVNERKKILEINTVRYKQENVFMQLINDELKTSFETKQWETVANAACKFMHAALASSMKHPVSKMGNASSVLLASIKSTENLISGPNGSSLQQSKLAGAIQEEDDIYVQQYLQNQKWEDEELILCLNYSQELYQHKGNQVLVKAFLPWICNECVKVHKPCKVYVWAASISKDTDVYGIPVLVCNYREAVDKKFKDKFFFGLAVVYQEYNTANEEEMSVQSSKIFLESILNPKEAMLANEIISLNTDWLMTNHSNLQVIKACPLRIRCLEVIKEVCIVLYCRMKGFIPFGEKPFPKTLSASAKSIAVDVREGFYIPAMLQENNDVINTEIPWDPHLFRMGCSVGPHDRHVSATVGPFVQLDGNNVGFLTCAHAFGVPNNIRNAIGMRVVHPANGEFAPVNPILPENLICGHVVNIAFDTADIHPRNDVNVDAALIRLNPDNVPHKGRFAWMNPRSLGAAGLNVGQSLRFDHGAIIMREDVAEILSQPGRIIKVGAESGVTSSNLLDPVRVVIRVGEAELLHEHGNIFPPIIGGTRSYVMRGQYLVRSNANNAFLATGDSGSGVFYMDEVKKIRCFGIAIGFVANTFEAVVTPIEDVLRAFNLDERALMRF